jgi:hypothetical protein
MEPVGTTAREWATAACRQAGFEPDARYTTTDLQIHLRLVESGLAAALLPDLSGAGNRHDVIAHRLQGRPRRQIFTTVRSGAARHPKVQAFTTALKAHGPGPARSGPEQQFPAARAGASRLTWQSTADFGQSCRRFGAGIGVERVVGHDAAQGHSGLGLVHFGQSCRRLKRVSGSNASSATMLRRATAPRAGSSSASLSAASKRSSSSFSYMAVSAFFERGVSVCAVRGWTKRRLPCPCDVACAGSIATCPVQPVIV